MSKIYLNENDLKQMVKESVNKILNEAIQNGELDEGLGHRLGQIYQWGKNKWDNFKKDFSSGQAQQNLKNQNYDPHGFWGNEADNVRSFANGGQGTTAPQASAGQGATAPQAPASQGATAPQAPAGQGAAAPQAAGGPNHNTMVAKNTLEQLMKMIGMKPQVSKKGKQVWNWTTSNMDSLAIQKKLLTQWRRLK